MNMDSLLARARSMLQPEPQVQEEERTDAMDQTAEEIDLEVAPVEPVEEPAPEEEFPQSLGDMAADAEGELSQPLEEMSLDADAPENEPVELDGPDDSLDGVAEFEDITEGPVEEGDQWQQSDDGDLPEVESDEDTQNELSWESHRPPHDPSLSHQMAEDADTEGQVREKSPHPAAPGAVNVNMPDGWQASLSDTISQRVSEMEASVNAQLDDEMQRSIYQLDITGSD